MTTYNTGNPIGSTDARDRLDNSENMDILENSTTLNAHPDRLGVMRKTRKGMELEHDNQIAAHEAEHDAQISAHETEHDNQMQSFENDFDSRLAGMAFTRVGTFTTGATLTDMRQTLLWELSQGGDGREYGWTGSFLPSGKVVSAGSSPTPVSTGNWVDRTDDRLRSDINIVVKTFNSVADMVADTSLVAGQTVAAINLNSLEHYSITATTTLANGLEVLGLSNGLKAELINSSELSIAKSKSVYISSPIALSNGKNLNLSFNTLVTSGTGAISLSGESRASDVRLSGDVSSGGAVNYAVFLDDSSNGATVSNLDADKYTGGVYAQKASRMHISNIKCTSPVYHPSLTSGGYGVLLEGCNHSTIDGLNFTVDSSNGDLGRHAVYLSAPGSDTALGCTAVKVNNVTAKYINVDNRDMWAINQRNGNFNSLSNITIDGANAGIAYNPTYGDIAYTYLTDSIINIFKYDPSLAVYGISEQNLTNNIDCVLRSNLITKVTPKNSSALYTGCYAAHLMGTNEFYGNSITAVPDHSTPLWLENVNNCLITNIVDKVLTGDGSISPFITFTGYNSNVKVTNILTNRPMFLGLDNVTNLTVDFRRKIDVTINAGTVSHTDADACVSSVTISGSNVLVTMKPHVTQKACDSAIVIANDINTSPLPIIASRSSKVLTVRGNTITGVVIPPSSGSLNFSVILSC